MTERTIHEQIAEVKRELALRERVYPGFVARGKMKQADADEHYARMKAALQTLLKVVEVGRLVRPVDTELGRMLRALSDAPTPSAERLGKGEADHG